MLVSRCSDVQAYLNKTASDPDLKDMVVTLLPDEVALRSININGRVFDGLPEILFRSLFHRNPFNPGSNDICNDLRSLPEVSRSNYYESINAVVEDDEVPVRCRIDELHRRISLIRLHHQSHQLGIRIDPDRPWNLKSICQTEGRDDESMSPADIIPNSPADWLPYDGIFSDSILEGGRALAKDSYEDFYFTRYCRHFNHDQNVHKLKHDESSCSIEMEDNPTFDASKAWDTLLDTITTLKEEGNTALQQGSVHLAARLYDKALAYCCAALFNYPQSNLNFLSSHQKLLLKNAGHYTRWSPLLKAFISVRLNLSMTLLKPSIADIEAAHSQAYLALQDLRPFTKKAGLVYMGKRLQKCRQDEPMQTFTEAKELEAKAYFRLGSVKMQGRQYASAMHMFEKCLQATKEYRPNSPPDRTVQHRLAEAKRLSEKERKKRRKQFRFAFGDDGSSDKDCTGDHEDEEHEL
jgi:tetratricopeptide (TPR) repeat protein